MIDDDDDEDFTSTTGLFLFNFFFILKYCDEQDIIYFKICLCLSKPPFVVDTPPIKMKRDVTSALRYPPLSSAP